MSKQTRNLRLNTEVTPENKNRSTHKKSLSIQQNVKPHHQLSSAELQKQKFAQQYAKITKQFHKILAKSSTHRKETSQSEQKKFFKAKSNREVTINERIEQQKKTNNGLGKLQSKNTKLQSLYSNKLHHQILQTVSKLQNHRKQRPAIVQILPSSTQQVSLLSPISPTTQFMQSPSQSPTNKAGDKQIFTMMQQQKIQKINKNFHFIQETLAHFYNIYKIFELLQNYKNCYALMIKTIKKYIMNHNKADITKLQNMLKLPYEKERLKIFLCLQKIAILGILDAMIRQNELCVKNQGKVVLEIIMGVYQSIIQYFVEQKLYNNVNQTGKLGHKKAPQNTQTPNILVQQCLQSLKICLDLLQSKKIQPRKDLQSTVEFLYKKYQNLFKSNLSLFHKIKQSLISITKVSINNNTIVINYEELGIKNNTNQLASIGITGHNNPHTPQGVNINRFFYYLLCEYAHHMNCYQNTQILKLHKNMLDFFVTCPSPHLVYSVEQDKITVVLQFQGTIAMVKSYNNALNNNKISITLRPYALQLVKQISKLCEVVIMTTLMPQNIPLSLPRQKSKSNFPKKSFQRDENISDYEQIFKLSTCVLFRYHYVRYRGLLMKDISRLGRKIQKLLLVDSIDTQAYSSGISISPPKYNQTTSTNNLNGSSPDLQNYTNTTIAHSYKEKNIPVGLNKSNSTVSHISQHLSVNLQNTIPITTWKGSQKDEQLMYLKQLLTKIAQQEPTDVRTLLKKYKLVVSGTYEQQANEGNNQQTINSRQNTQQNFNVVQQKNVQKQERQQAIQKINEIRLEHQKNQLNGNLNENMDGSIKPRNLHSKKGETKRSFQDN